MTAYIRGNSISVGGARVGAEPVNLTSLLNPQPWAEQASCGQADPEEWYPDQGGSTRTAKRICRDCPVRVECLRDAAAA